MNGMIFISYASEDTHRAAQFTQLLRAKGVEVWFAPRDISPTGNIVRHIEEALDKARVVLVLWSRHAAASRWVQTERDSALARMLNGAPVRVIMARLDEEQLPPLSAAERFLDLYSDATWDEELAKLFVEAPTHPVDDIDTRVAETEVPRSLEIQTVVRHIQRGEPVVVLAPRKGGSHTFARQLQAHLCHFYPQWDVVGVPAQALADEQVSAYLERLRTLMGVHDVGGRLVVCIHGWSRSPQPYQDALGRELRVHLEGGTRQRPFSLVAVGSYPLFLLRYSDGQWSVLNNAMQVDLPDLMVEQIHVLMNQSSPAQWSSEDAGEVWRRGGGHPYLTKLLLRAWLRNPGGGWAAAEEQLVEDSNYLLPTLALAMQRQGTKDELCRFLEEPSGLDLDLLQPHAPRLFLYYAGLLRKEGRRLKFRCSVVKKLVKKYLY